MPRQLNGERNIFSTNDAGTIGCQYGKENVTSYTKISLKVLIDLKIKAKIAKLIEGNMGECLCHLVVFKDFLERIQIYHAHNKTYERGAFIFSI